MKFYPIAMLSLCMTTILTSVQAAQDRWFNDDQVSQGEVLYLQNCASCHGKNAEARADWQQASGEEAAPPLNGTAHTWHHSLKQLSQTIQQGSLQIGGAMPAFKSKLSDQDTDNLIAFIQSKWPDQVYSQWAEKFQVVAINDGMTRLLKQRLGSVDIKSPQETGIEGVYQTRIGDKYAYLIEGGRYVFIGDLVDLKLARNITEVSRRADAVDAIKQIPVADRVIFPAQGAEKAVLNVFTDTSCGYCQKLHQEVGHLQNAGISVHYFPFPRGGSRGPGYQDLKSVWCAPDQKLAMDIAKGVSGGQLTKGDCDRANVVDQGFDLGRKVGITGTPTLFTADGTKFPGYVPYAELIPQLLKQ